MFAYSSLTIAQEATAAARKKKRTGEVLAASKMIRDAADEIQLIEQLIDEKEAQIDQARSV